MEADVTSSGGNSTSAPATFAEAFAAETSPVSDPSPQSTTTPAAVQPGTEAQALPQGTEDREPFIPRARFDEVNTKKTELETALNDWKPYEWARQIQPQEFQQIQQIARHFQNGDPITGLTNLIAEIRRNPEYDAALKSLAARQLSQRAPAAPQAPQMVNVQLEDGSVVEMPRNPAEWLAHQKAQWLAEVKQELQPVTQTVEGLQAERAALQQAQAVSQYVETTYADVKTWPGMETEAAQKAVAQQLATMQVNEHDPREISLALNQAYRQVILPTLSQRAQSQQLDDLKRKAAATSVNPGSTANATARTYNSFAELPPEMWR